MRIFGKPNGTLNILRVQWKTPLEMFYLNWTSESFSDRDLTIGFRTVKMDLVKVGVHEAHDMSGGFYIESLESLEILEFETRIRFIIMKLWTSFPGPFCSQKGLKPTLQNSLLNSIAKGTISPNQLIAIVYNVEAESYEKVFRLISQSNVGRVFVTSKSQNSALQMDQWEEFGRSVVGNWPSCGCWDINECTMGRSTCNEDETCLNALGKVFICCHIKIFHGSISIKNRQKDRTIVSIHQNQFLLLEENLAVPQDHAQHHVMEMDSATL